MRRIPRGGSDQSMAVHVQMPAGIIRIGSQNTFFQLLRTYREYLIVAVFTRAGCRCSRQCVMQMDRVRDSIEEEILFLEVDVGNLPELADFYRVTQTPTTALFYQQKLREWKAGSIPEWELREYLANWSAVIQE